ncbi:MAG: hypothetical protein ABSC14_04120 [Desulfomonilia bacterium]
MKKSSNIFILVFVGMITLCGYIAFHENAYAGDMITGNMQAGSYKGSLVSNKVHTSSLTANDVWLLHGKQGSRVVITDAVEAGHAPPDIYLYPPGGTVYEARSDTGSDRYRVIDRNLEFTGDYVVLVHNSDPSNALDYELTYTTFPMNGSYQIDPDDIDENLIKPTPSRLYQPRSGGIATSAIAVDEATMGLGPLFYGIFIGIGSTVEGVASLFEKSSSETKDKDTCPMPVIYNDKELVLCAK